MLASTLVVLGLFCAVVFVCGRRLALAAGIAHGDLAAAWVLGLLAMCLATYAAVLVVPLTAATAFALIGVAVLAAEVALRRRYPVPEVDTKGLVAFAGAVALTAAWCAEPAGAYAVLRSEGVLPAWQDYFIHGGVISQFGDPRALGRQSIYLADFPSSFYHFASYAGAAALAWPLDLPGLALSTSAWLPLGFLAMSAGAIALGQRLAGAAGGLAALAAVAVIPDASNYGLRNGLFSFHWMMLSHPGGDYALAAAFLSLALVGRARAASAALALAVLLLRAQFFLLFFVPWFAVALLCALPAGTRRRFGALSVVAVLLGAAATLYLLIPELDAAGWRVRLGSLEVFLDVMHHRQEPTAYTGVYHELASRGGSLPLLAGVGLTLAAALGAFIVLLPAALAAAYRRGVLQPIDAFAGCVIAWWLLLIGIAPEPWIGEGTNLLFQPFPLVYASAAIWTLCLLARCLPPRRAWAALLLLVVAGGAAIAFSAPRLAHPKFDWGQEGAAQRVPPGLVAAADFLRANAARGDIFAASGLREEFDLFDLATQVASLTGMPAYLSRPHLEMIKGEPRRSVVLARLRAIREMEGQADYDAAMRLLGAMGVRWYVHAGERGPRFDPGRSRAAFSSGALAVYRTP